MGRTKPVAKRRRVGDVAATVSDSNAELLHNSQHAQQRKAIEALLQADPEEIEIAAATATREACRHWPKLPVLSEEKTQTTTLNRDDDQEGEQKEGSTIVPPWLRGLGRARPVQHFNVFQKLHKTIKDKTQYWTSWSGSKSDPRKRAFGILPGTLGYKAEIRERLDISTPWKEDKLQEEQKRNNRAIVLLDVLPDGTQKAIEELCRAFAEDMPTSSSLRSYLQFRNLIAVQPNLHCDRELLPAHVDHPSKDGFGVIIVTISIVSSGTIMLQDNLGHERRVMDVEEGQAYMLSDKARDACTHGVITKSRESANRESLNLRFGLHDLDQGDNEHPLCSSNSVLQYWERKHDLVPPPKKME